MTKIETRNLIKLSMTNFIANGNKITSGKTYGGKKSYLKIKDTEHYIKIDVDALPENLKKFLKVV